jgi:hypothetical protein
VEGQAVNGDKKVVSLRGDALIPGEVDAQLVTYLEGLLADAKDGHIRAFAFVAMKDTGTIRRWWTAQPPFNNALLGALTRVQHQLAHSIENAAEVEL